MAWERQAWGNPSQLSAKGAGARRGQARKLGTTPRGAHSPELQREPQLKHSRTQFLTWVYVLSSQGEHTVFEVLLQNDCTW